ncbi:MAG: deoxynucleoside kinase [Mycoplasmataceae bacterium]|nr:deoxynucleoside kinase [Mycoplasmataceae bacterium]
MDKKYANLIIIGGTIAAGKSTLIEGIAKRKGFISVPELREGDIVQNIILEKLYEGTRIHAATIQSYFLSNRFKQYRDSCSGLVTSILDRGLWEDWFFALLLMKKEPKSYEHFKKLWKSTIINILDRFGYPKAYIYTKVNWENFKDRIFNRGREAEIENFSSNKEYFKNLLNEYNDNFIDLLNDFGIIPIVIDTNELTKEEVADKASEELSKLGI